MSEQSRRVVFSNQGIVVPPWLSGIGQTKRGLKAREQKAREQKACRWVVGMTAPSNDWDSEKKSKMLAFFYFLVSELSV